MMDKTLNWHQQLWVQCVCKQVATNDISTDLTLLLPMTLYQITLRLPRLKCCYLGEALGTAGNPGALQLPEGLCV